MKIAVVSLKFSPGHIAHLRAYRELFLSITNDVELFLAPEYEGFICADDRIIYINDIHEIIKSTPDLVLIYNISIKNYTLAKECQLARIKTIYILHEPRGSLPDLFTEGKAILKAIGAHYVNRKICHCVDKVILASENGRMNYERYMINCNRKHDVFPLIFMDEYDSEKIFRREYFSFIGAFVEAHACNKFIQFMEYVLVKNIDIKFLIATKNDISGYLRNNKLQEAINLGNLTVHHGRPMNTEEINGFYRQSICVWNAYNRSTQSGVLSNALMQGTPIITNEIGAAKEIMPDKTAGCFITMPPENERILDCYRYIKEHIGAMEQNARKVFLSKYYYKNYLDLAKEVFLS